MSKKMPIRHNEICAQNELTIDFAFWGCYISRFVLITHSVIITFTILQSDMKRIQYSDSLFRREFYTNVFNGQGVCNTIGLWFYATGSQFLSI